MRHRAESSSTDGQLAACLQAIQQAREVLPPDLVVAVDTALIDRVFAPDDRSRVPVPCFAVRA